MRIHARQFFALFEVLTGLYAGRGPLHRTSRNRAPSTSVRLRPPSCSGALLQEALLIGPLPLHCFIRGSHIFSIPASINGEVPGGSFLLGVCILRSSHSLLICRSCSRPPTLKNSESRSFPNYFSILCLTKFTLWHC